MKVLNECKEYFKDVLKDYYQYPDDKFYLFRLETLADTLTWIYGDDFKKIRPYWTQDAIKEFYKN